MSNGKKLEDLLKKQPDWVQAELQVIRQHEPVILRALANKENKDLFINDPAALLIKLGILVSGALRNRMRDGSLSELTKPISFRLPNEQVLKPRINIRFTKGKV